MCQDNKKGKISAFSPVKWILLSILAVIGVAVGYWLVLQKLIPESQIAGQFGDAFGTINAIFSGLAFCGLLIALHMQRKELEYQREELQLTRQEMEKSTKAQEESSKQLAEQASLIRQQHNEEYRPFINAYFDLKEYYLCLILENSGKMPAYKVELLVENGLCIPDTAFENELNKVISSCKLDVFPPGAKYSMRLAQWFRIQKNADKITDNMQLRISFTHKGIDEKFITSIGISHLKLLSLNEETQTSVLKEINMTLTNIKQVISNLKK